MIEEDLNWRCNCCGRDFTIDEEEIFNEKCPSCGSENIDSDEDYDDLREVENDAY